MGLAQKSLSYFEPEEYLLLEANSKDKHEYMDGAIYAWQGTTPQGMAGASIDHVRVVMNVYVSLRSQARRTGCEAFTSELRLRPDGRTAYFYPDVLVRCGPDPAGSAMEVDDAVLIVEVLSDTTESFDRQDKFERYRRMETLQSYVLISPTRGTIEVFRADQGWQPSGFPTRAAADANVDLGVNGWSLLPADVFDGVTPKDPN